VKPQCRPFVLLRQHGASALLALSAALMVMPAAAQVEPSSAEIAAGAPLDHVNNLHWTALIEAVVLGDGGPRHQATVRALVEAGADRRLTDRHGRTALELARERGYAELVRLLGA
jgi:uncharacterized protein